MSKETVGYYYFKQLTLGVISLWGLYMIAMRSDCVPVDRRMFWRMLDASCSHRLDIYDRKKKSISPPTVGYYVTRMFSASA